MSEVYEQVGYGSREIGYGERAAVLVVDFQVAFTDPKWPLGNMPLTHRAVDNTARLLETARSLGLPIAKCYTAYHSARDMPYWKVKAVMDDFLYGHPCTALEPKVDDPSYDFNFCKSAPSIFFMTPLVTFLTRHGVDTVIVTGCTTSGCVRASVIDAFSYGYRVIVPEDCSGDADLEPHQDNLRDVGRRYADITKCDAVIAQLTGGGRSGRRATG